VIFTQFVDGDLGCASYLIGCEEAKEAVVVDPAYAIEQYLDEAAHRDVRLVRVIETHTHADHVSGHGRLALDHGLPVSIHRLAGAEYAHDPLEDGQQIDVGTVRLTVIHTPGHRPEHCCIAVTDRSRADEPWLCLTGDSLFVGDAARPDLAVGAEEGAEGLFHSLRHLLELPDGVEVYPGHVAGSLCGRGMSTKASTTIGFERRFNRALALATVEEFVRDSASITTPRPPNMERIVELNRGPFLGAPPGVDAAGAAGAFVLDVRPADDFARGHVPGAVNVPVSGSSFATKAGFVVPSNVSVAIHGSSREEVEQAATGLRSVAFLDLRRLASPRATETLDPLSIDELEPLLEDDLVELVDVREPDETAAEPLPGARSIPYRLARELAATLPRDRTIVPICESGARAAIAGSIFQAEGFDVRPVTRGGIRDVLARQPVASS
jgi:glyoxylase-like metal-dependent hydrolase (beta-lactamase superfamily II)/rhodanese-related sulfurtransferase